MTPSWSGYYHQQLAVLGRERCRQFEAWRGWVLKISKDGGSMAEILVGTPACLGRYQQQLSGVITEQYSQYSRLNNDQPNKLWVSNGGGACSGSGRLSSLCQGFHLFPLEHLISHYRAWTGQVINDGFVCQEMMCYVGCNEIACLYMMCRVVVFCCT